MVVSLVPSMNFACWGLHRILSPLRLPFRHIGKYLTFSHLCRYPGLQKNLVRGHIEVKAAKAKSARRRIVQMQQNLSAWIRPYSEMKGRLVPEGYRSKLERVRKAAGLCANYGNLSRLNVS